MSLIVDAGGGTARASAAPTSAPLPKRTDKDRSQFVLTMRRYVERVGVDTGNSVLIVGGTNEDVTALLQCGFHYISLSNIEAPCRSALEATNRSIIAIDVENINLPDRSYDMVIAHEVLHHCRCPHRALCEMLRVARHHVVMMEPNDSSFMAFLCKLKFSYPFEIAAVVDNDYICGGVRNSQVPNFIYRWNRHEVHKAVSSFLAEQSVEIYADPYWDFNVQARDLAYRRQTRIGMITTVIGARNFIRLLRVAQFGLNRLPLLRAQGNKFFCGINKDKGLHPWLTVDYDGRVAFDRRFQQQLK